MAPLPRPARFPGSDDPLSQWMAEHQHGLELLRADFRGHETGPGHGSADLLARIQRLEGIVLGVGGAIVVTQLGVLGALLKVVLKI